jgi:hypothetical protein
MARLYVINNQRIKRFKQQNTQQDEDCDKYQEQNESSVDPVQDTISSIESFYMVWKIKYSATKSDTEM